MTSIPSTAPAQSPMRAQIPRGTQSRPSSQRSAPTSSCNPASRNLRVGSYMIDLLAIWACAALAWFIRPSLIFVGTIVLELFLVLTLVRARTGRTLGALATRTVAVAAGTDHAPGLKRQGIRSAIIGLLHVTVIGPVIVVWLGKDGRDWVDSLAGTATLDLRSPLRRPTTAPDAYGRQTTHTLTSENTGWTGPASPSSHPMDEGDARVPGPSMPPAPQPQPQEQAGSQQSQRSFGMWMPSLSSPGLKPTGAGSFAVPSQPEPSLAPRQAHPQEAPDPLAQPEVTPAQPAQPDGFSVIVPPAAPAQPAPDVAHPEPIASNSAAVPLASQSAAGVEKPENSDDTSAPAPAPEEQPDRAGTPKPNTQHDQKNAEIWLVFDSGEKEAVIGTTVIGRAPVTMSPSERAVTVEDSTRSLSRTHLRLGPAPGGVWVEDAFSANGTSVTLPDGSVFELERGNRQAVPIGATLRAGERSITINSPHSQQ